jgi:Anti-sigma-K factor rskA
VLARQADVRDGLQDPSPEVWSRIAAAALGGNGSGAAADTGAGAAAAAGPGRRMPATATAARTAQHRGLRAWAPRGPLAAVLASLLAALIIGAGTAVAVHERGADRQPPAAAGTQVVARIVLAPLPEFPQWRNASGSAVMEATSRGRLLTVQLIAPRRPGFYEVWLLARNGVSMISIGDLNSAHFGQFSMPPGVDLRKYSRIDISLQPFNGSTAHAPASVVRGSLPQ